MPQTLVSYESPAGEARKTASNMGRSKPRKPSAPCNLPAAVASNFAREADPFGSLRHLRLHAHRSPFGGTPQWSAKSKISSSRTWVIFRSTKVTRHPSLRRSFRSARIFSANLPSMQPVRAITASLKRTAKSGTKSTTILGAVRQSHRWGTTGKLPRRGSCGYFAKL